MLEQEEELNFFLGKQHLHVAAIVPILAIPMINLFQILAKETC